MTEIKNHDSKDRDWPWGTQKEGVISLPKLPPEWETITDDPIINRVANLAHLALATSLYSQIYNLSFKERYQIEKMFEEECLSSKEFFVQSAQNMKGNISSRRVDFVKEGDAWVDDTDRWLHTNLRGQIDFDAWKDLVRRLYSLIDVHNVLWSISIEHFKSVEVNIQTKLCKILKSNTKTEQKAEGTKIMITARTSKEIWEAIKSEYDICKKDFGKKINFVSDSFKRKIIFRDVEHAFVLASQGFSKPALILAGGVIEELLRLYLEHKNIKPLSNNFDGYIKTCEQKKLLKKGIFQLSDSLRHFRNLVHLDNEKTERHTLSTAAAKGAVSSIFTIANDFQ